MNWISFQVFYCEWRQHEVAVRKEDYESCNKACVCKAQGHFVVSGTAKPRKKGIVNGGWVLGGLYTKKPGWENTGKKEAHPFLVSQKLWHREQQKHDQVSTWCVYTCRFHNSLLCVSLCSCDHSFDTGCL